MATLVLTILGFTLGSALAFAAKVFAVAESNPIVEEIEAMLPNSQCGQCGFAGCKPAAEAMADGSADPTCCPPGGRALAERVAELLGIDINTLGESAAPQLASIDESLCTGCTRCYKACPTDAIVGANKQIHAVIKSACTGCGKCLDACPEDCIHLGAETPDLHNWQWPKPMVA
ncbi:RnfABCDGE type electron transport complex subunit B [Mangrovimicrobium sediminis]|nr:RnfABCDGE type electron transport complex subunit B [Haliea sp. SAOS-164]